MQRPSHPNSLFKDIKLARKQFNSMTQRHILCCPFFMCWFETEWFFKTPNPNHTCIWIRNLKSQIQTQLNFLETDNTTIQYFYNTFSGVTTEDLPLGWQVFWQFLATCCNPQVMPKIIGWSFSVLPFGKRCVTPARVRPAGMEEKRNSKWTSINFQRCAGNWWFE